MTGFTDILFSTEETMDGRCYAVVTMHTQDGACITAKIPRAVKPEETIDQNKVRAIEEAKRLFALAV